MALGGVATGIMKAKEVARAAEDMKYSGFTCSLRDCTHKPHYAHVTQTRWR